VREQWLVKRHAMIPTMMRRQGARMWVVVHEEFHNDPHDGVWRAMGDVRRWLYDRL
jgi:hypothetical protein